MEGRLGVRCGICVGMDGRVRRMGGRVGGRVGGKGGRVGGWVGGVKGGVKSGRCGQGVHEGSGRALHPFLPLGGATSAPVIYNQRPLVPGRPSSTLPPQAWIPDNYY